jgi:hypothetical protein
MSAFLENMEQFLADDRRNASVASFTGPCNLLSSDYKRLYVKLEEAKKVSDNETLLKQYENELDDLLLTAIETAVKNRPQ